MDRFRCGAVSAAVVFALAAGWTTAAFATPTKTSPCSNCHSGANVGVTATQTSVTSSSAVYRVSAPTATAIAIFQGSTKVAYVVGTTANFSVSTGKTYTIFAVKGPTTSDGIGQTSVSPVAPPVDTTPPVTSTDATVSYAATATITLSATDAGGSGVAATYYVLDGGLQTIGTKVIVASPGGHTLEYWSADGAGNVELHKLIAFVIQAPADTTAPITTSNAAATYNGSASITLTATDVGGSGVAGIYYILDGGAQVAGNQALTSAPGAHTLEFWSIDGAGNVETPHKTANFSVAALPDTTAPVTTSDALASYIGTATVTFVATDTGGSGVAHTYYRLDAGAQTEANSLTTTALGSHSVEFWSVDGAGNAEAPHKVANFSVTAPANSSDKTPPTTASNAVASYTTTATIRFTATDNRYGAGVSATYYVLDGGLRAAGTSVTVGAPGNHTLEFWSIDKAANEELPHKSVSFLVDPIAPTTTSDARAFYNGTATVKLSGIDNAGGCGVANTYYKLDGSTQTSGTIVSASSAGQHTVEFWSRDALGNSETPHKTATFTIDLQAPVTSCDATAAYTKPATVRLGATDAGGSGVAGTYFILDGAPAQKGTQALAYLPGVHRLEYWSEDNAANAERHRTISFTVDPLAPYTTSNVKATYVGPATVTLTATDTGGAGVAATYYRLDGGPQTAGTSVRATRIASHTLTFWSVDAFGNAEMPKTVAFVVKPVPYKVTVIRLPYASLYTVKRVSGVARYTLKAKLKKPSGAALVGARVYLQARVSATKPWTTMYVLKTSTTGSVAHTYVKRRASTVYYRWYVPATSLHNAAVTGSQKVVVK